MISSESHSHTALILEALEIGDELYWDPCRQVISAWPGHLATAFWLIKAARPTLFVELGTHNGSSYSAFCQAIAQLGLPARAFAVDTWHGDEHSGKYGEEVFEEFQAFNESHFAGFSKLLRGTFDEVRSYFSEGSIDLLHIDGLHTYEAVKRDFDIWKSSLSPNAVVVFHDTNVRERDFGVWKLWQELAEVYPSFEFHHSAGLGILGVGPDQPRLLRRLFELGRDPRSSAIIRRIFAARGEAFLSRSQFLDLADRFAAVSSQLQTQSHRASALEQDVTGRDATLADREQEIRTKAEAIGNLQQELVGRDTALRNRDEEIKRVGKIIQQCEQTIVSKDKMLGTRQEMIAELEESAAKLREQLAAATRRLDEERSTALERIGLLQHELAGVQHTLGLIEGSTAWKFVSHIRSSFQDYPAFRRFVRRMARLLWWIVTLQLFGRLRARRRLFQTRDLIAKSAFFDPSWYLSQYPDVADFGDDLALHYALFGATERRNPGPRFDAEAYLQRYPEVSQAGFNPLVHYLEYGASEGREIRAVGPTPQESKIPPEVPGETLRRDYQTWVGCYDTLSEDDKRAILDHIELLQVRPLISVIMPVYNTNPAFLCNALDSLLAQLYPYWEVCIADDASTDPAIRRILNQYASRDRRIKVVFRSTNGHISAASNSALELATGPFLALLDHDDALSLHALYLVAVELDQHPDTDIIYSDEDRIDESGTRSDPHFKPEWNLELFHSYNMINHLGVYRTSLVRSLGSFREGFEGSQDYDLALRIVDSTREDRIRHIPHVLYHWRAIASTFSTTNLTDAVEAGRRALAEHFERRGENVRLVEGSKPYITRVIRPVPEPPPLVSLVIPTRDRFALLKICVEGLLHKTDYPNMEILIIDNESQETETLAYLQALNGNPRVKILEVPGPFNFSALNNLAVAAASGEIIGFINNDIEVIEPAWLTEMVGQVVQPGVGAVGAKLLYPDGRIQHAGVILGLGGVAGHSHKCFPRYDFGYFCRLQLTYNVSCVTAACMLMPKKVFQEVHGFDEVNLTVAFNDVDLCLKIREAGYSIVWTPYAELYHHESASRGSDEIPEKAKRATQEIEFMKERWGDRLLNDPFYSPNLTLDYENYAIGFPPRSVKPWRVAALTKPLLATHG